MKIHNRSPTINEVRKSEQCRHTFRITVAKCAPCDGYNLNCEHYEKTNKGAADAGVFFCTAYCTEQYPHICGEGHGITASGQPIQAGVTVAADQSIFPYGTVLYIEGVGIRIVQDKGAGVQGAHLDVAVDTHENALAWSGYGEHRVWILKGE